ncbi:MAG TPA: ribosome-associated translation inhibitor RaiA [Gaiellales bacterium]|jgi:putative sigma-54 modulation protein|nr:ribosome-associated translation inhibitor RaiA [Gaiellales bacterium]
MDLQVKGRNVDVTDPLFSYAERKLGKLSRHLSDGSRCELELAVEHNPSISEPQVAEATVWTKGPVLRARESSADMYASIDMVAEKLERQVKRYRERRTRKQAQHLASHSAPAANEPPALPDEENAVIVKQKQFNMKPMPPEEAILQLELIGHDFFVFTNADTDEVNVVYKRRDGNYGLIEPSR